jgi:hypothetical protein
MCAESRLRSAGVPSTVALRYQAFISYSHADAAWAKWLHRKLESFQLGDDSAPSNSSKVEGDDLPTATRKDVRARENSTMPNPAYIVPFT